MWLHPTPFPKEVLKALLRSRNDEEIRRDILERKAMQNKLSKSLKTELENLTDSMEDELSPDKVKGADLDELDTEEAEADEFYSEEAEADEPDEPNLD